LLKCIGGPPAPQTERYNEYEYGEVMMTNTHHYFLIMQKWQCWKKAFVEKGTLLFSGTFELIMGYSFFVYFFHVTFSLFQTKNMKKMKN
jgi:hypothetical protein